MKRSFLPHLALYFGNLCALKKKNHILKAENMQFDVTDD